MYGRVITLPLAAALFACASLPDPGVRLQPTAPHARDVDWAETTFTGAGGRSLYAQRWRPIAVAPKAVVVIHHGLADHSSRYAAFAERLVRAGYAVWALDMRGHGRSAGPRVAIDRMDDFLDDLDAFFALVRREQPGQRAFLYGHSIGGLISCLYAIERHPDLAGLVLASPGLAIDGPPVLPGTIRVVAALAPSAPLFATPHRGFSQRDEVVAEMDHDPLIAQPPAPARTARAAVDGIHRVWAAPAQLVAPLLVVHGDADAITAPSGSRDIVARAGSSDKTLRLYDGLVHDLLREPDGGGERVAAEVVAWIDAHAGGPAVDWASSKPAGSLRGDHHGQAISVELDARGERPDEGDLGATAGLRLRLGVGRASALGLGYVGGLDLRGGVVIGKGEYEADAHVLGLGVRAESGAVVAITGGLGIGGVRGAGATHLPVELSAELPAGPVRLIARAGLAWRLGGDRYADDAHGLADEASALVGFRLGRDVRYWSSVSSGGGPFLAMTYRDLGGAEIFGVALGVELWGGN